ncbi:protein Mpv17-like [Ornithodoros turicata]|uniref:protein Mpv17-like n=1 Tax=Ornithodoros turicata TaxID=34597 RepID=UPI003139217F
MACGFLSQYVIREYYRYARLLAKHPFKTQVLTTGTLMGSSDIVSQTLIERNKIDEVDFLRAGRFFILGSGYVGPLIRYWYIFLDRRFGTISKTAGLKKLFVDQGLFAPVYLPSILVVLGILQGKGPEGIKTTIKEDAFTILKTAYMIWPAAQLVNFYIIPLHLRLLYSNSVAVIWNTYLSWKANRLETKGHVNPKEMIYVE